MKVINTIRSRNQPSKPSTVAVTVQYEMSERNQFLYLQHLCRVAGVPFDVLDIQMKYSPTFRTVKCIRSIGRQQFKPFHVSSRFFGLSSGRRRSLKLNRGMSKRIRIAALRRLEEVDQWVLPESNLRFWFYWLPNCKCIRFAKDRFSSAFVIVGSDFYAVQERFRNYDQFYKEAIKTTQRYDTKR